MARNGCGCGRANSRCNIGVRWRPAVVDGDCDRGLSHGGGPRLHQERHDHGPGRTCLLDDEYGDIHGRREDCFTECEDLHAVAQRSHAEAGNGAVRSREPILLDVDPGARRNFLCGDVVQHADAESLRYGWCSVRRTDDESPLLNVAGC